MANHDADNNGPRVGGWVPPYREQRKTPLPATDETADRLYATPAGDTGFGRHGDAEHGRSRAVLIVAAIVAMVLLSGGGIAYVMHNQHPSSAAAAPYSPPGPALPEESTGFTDTQQNPGLSVSVSPSAGGSVPAAASAGLPSEVTTSSLPTLPPPATKAPAPTTKPAAPGKTTSTGNPNALSSVTPGLAISLEPTSLPGTRLRHFAGDAYVQKIDTSSSTARADAKWIVHNGLGDSTCVSFESANFRGQYLRRSDGRLRKDAPDGSSQFNVEATFCTEKVNSSSSRVQLRTADTFQYMFRQDDYLYLGAPGDRGETFIVHPPL